MIRVIIVDDQVILRESLKYIIEQDPVIEVVGLAGNGREAERLVAEVEPQIVLMDIMMPECDGVEGTRLVKEVNPAVKVMVLTTFADDQNIASALQNGAEGYMLKDIKPEALVLAIKSMAEGIPILHPKAFQALMKDFGNGIEQPSATAGLGPLNEREHEILRLIVDGKSNKEIASVLHFSEGTVKNMLTAMLDKFNVKDRTQLAVLAVKNHLV